MFIYLMVLDTEEEKIKFVKIYDAYKDRCIIQQVLS